MARPRYKRYGLTPTAWHQLRGAVLARDNWRCVRCRSGDDLTLDHVVPVSKGGATTYENLQTMCGFCNREKADRIQDYR